MKETIGDEMEEITLLNNKIDKLDRMLEDRTAVACPISNLIKTFF